MKSPVPKIENLIVIPKDRLFIFYIIQRRTNGIPDNTAHPTQQQQIISPEISSTGPSTARRPHRANACKAKTCMR